MVFGIYLCSDCRFIDCCFVVACRQRWRLAILARTAPKRKLGCIAGLTVRRSKKTISDDNDRPPCVRSRRLQQKTASCARKYVRVRGHANERNRFARRTHW